MQFEVREQITGEGILSDVIEELAEKLEGQWGYYETEEIENIYPLKRYSILLCEGTVEYPGPIVFNVRVDIFEPAHEEHRRALVTIE